MRWVFLHVIPSVKYPPRSLLGGGEGGVHIPDEDGPLIERGRPQEWSLPITFVWVDWQPPWFVPRKGVGSNIGTKYQVCINTKKRHDD